MFELTVAAEVHVLLVEADGDKKHLLLSAALAHSQDLLLALELLAARPAAEHGDTTLRTHTAIRAAQLEGGSAGGDGGGKRGTSPGGRAAAAWC